MLNLVCHLSGIATATAAWVDAVEGTKAKIRDTRKTLPGLRALQKYAVRVGGGVNHRMGLGDAALIKDNHVAAAGSVVAALRAVRAAAPDLPCEVEVDTLEQLDEVLGEDVQLILLDNFPVWQTQIAVQRRDSRAPGCCWSPPAGCPWTPPPSTPAPASTTWPSARSPTRCGCSTSAWTCDQGLGHSRRCRRRTRRPRAALRPRAIRGSAGSSVPAGTHPRVDQVQVVAGRCGYRLHRRPECS